MPDSTSPAGEAESSGGLWPAIRKLFDTEGSERSLRSQLEDAIDEHEGENREDDDADRGKGDLSGVERQMLRNLLHFSEHDADDVAVPRGEIIAMDADATWEDLIATFSEHGHSRMPVYRDQLDDVVERGNLQSRSQVGHEVGELTVERVETGGVCELGAR